MARGASAWPPRATASTSQPATRPWSRRGSARAPTSPGRNYWSQGGRHRVVYHGSAGGCYHAEVGSNFDREDHQGLFYGPETSYPEFGKAADCTLFRADGRWNMIYTAGPRLEQSIAFAFEVTTDDVVVDNTSSAFSRGGAWTVSRSTAGFYGDDYLHDGSAGTSPGSWARWRPTLPASGFYKVLVRWPAHANRADRVRYKVYHRDGASEVVRDQRVDNGSWVYLGRYYFSAGSSDASSLTVDAGSDDGVVVADAARFLRNP